MTNPVVYLGLREFLTRTDAERQRDYNRKRLVIRTIISTKEHLKQYFTLCRKIGFVQTIAPIATTLDVTTSRTYKSLATDPCTCWVLNHYFKRKTVPFLACDSQRPPDGSQDDYHKVWILAYTHGTPGYDDD